MKSGGFSCELWFSWFDFDRNDMYLDQISGQQSLVKAAITEILVDPRFSIRRENELTS